MSVSHSVHWGERDRVPLVPGPFLIPGPMSFLWGRVSLVPCSFWRRGRVSLVPCHFLGGGYTVPPSPWIPYCPCIPYPQLSQKTGGTHPTEMLSCMLNINIAMSQEKISVNVYFRKFLL